MKKAKLCLIPSQEELLETKPAKTVLQAGRIIDL
tara:strand:- start:294 stop:395 length:102 start_codon:yes stop_codon:yes gene_type:complete